jgi:hypothetical protein
VVRLQWKPVFICQKSCLSHTSYIVVLNFPF